MEAPYNTSRVGVKGGLFVAALIAHAIPDTPRFETDLDRRNVFRPGENPLVPSWTY